MVLDNENILWEHEKLKLLNQQLQTQVTTLQNNSAQIRGELENNRSHNLFALDEFIQKLIMEAKSLGYPPPIAKFTILIYPKVRVPEEILDPHFRLLLWSEWFSSTHSIIPGQDGDLLP